MDYLNSFIDNWEDYLDVTEKILFCSLSDQVCLCHSKAIYSTAGCMIGSYNYTNSACLYNHEHTTLFGPGTPFAQQLMDQLQVQWNSGCALVSVQMELQLYKMTRKLNCFSEVLRENIGQIGLGPVDSPMYFCGFKTNCQNYK